MAASYFLGCRSGISKKSGEWFGCITVLCLNQFRQWASVPYWVADKETFDVIMDGLSIGCAVSLSLRQGDLKVTDLQTFDDVPSLPLLPPSD